MRHFQSAVHAFIDTLKMFKGEYPQHQSYKLEDLVGDVLGEQYDAHNAEADVAALRKLVVAKGIQSDVLKEYTFSVISTEKRFRYNEQKSENCSTLMPLVDSGSITKSMCDKIGGSGLMLNHLKRVYRRDGRRGIKDLFRERVGNSNDIRVTTSDRIIDDVCDFLDGWMCTVHCSWPHGDRDIG